MSELQNYFNSLINSSDISSQYKLAHIHTILNNFDKAKQLFETIVNNPQYCEMYELVLERALFNHDHNFVVKTLKDNSTSLFILAKLYTENDMLATASQTYDIIHGTTEEIGLAQFLNGKILYKLGLYSDAHESFKKSISNGNIEACNYISDIYMKNSMYSLCKEIYQSMATSLFMTIKDVVVAEMNLGILYIIDDPSDIVFGKQLLLSAFYKSLDIGEYTFGLELAKWNIDHNDVDTAITIYTDIINNSTLESVKSIALSELKKIKKI